MAKSNSKSQSVLKSFASFTPTVGQDPKILILGTAPGVHSLKVKEYYANSKNLFWDIISQRYNNGSTFANYQAKISCLHSHNIALWDVYKSGMRINSKNSTITSAKRNDITKFLKNNPSIELIIFNGKDAAVAAYNHSITISIPILILPYTGGPYSQKMSKTKRISIWKSFLP